MGAAGDELTAWAQLVEYGDPVHREEFLDLLDDPDSSATAFEILRALQALDFDDDGRMYPEPVLVRAWHRHLGGSTSD